MKRTSVLVLAVGATLAVPAFAQVAYAPSERIVTYVRDPATGAYVERSAVVYDNVAPPAVITYEYPSDPVYGDAAYTDEIVVSAPRATTDSLITADVVDAIATDPRVSGRVGVDTFRNNVTLTGRVGTQGQADRAERDARAVPGVSDVNNLVRPAVGNF